MKKTSLKKLQLRKSVVASLGKREQRLLLGGNDSAAQCQPYSDTCLQRCLLTRPQICELELSGAC